MVSPHDPFPPDMHGGGFSKSSQIALCATLSPPPIQGLFARGRKSPHSRIYGVYRGCSTFGRWGRWPYFLNTQNPMWPNLVLIICSVVANTSRHDRPPAKKGGSASDLAWQTTITRWGWIFKSAQIALCATLDKLSMQGLFARVHKSPYSAIYVAHQGCSTKGRWSDGLIFQLPKISLRSISH